MRRKNERGNNGTIQIGRNVTGSNINVGGRNIKQNVGNISNENIQNVFRPIVTQAQRIKDPALREDALEILGKMQVEAGKGTNANEKRVYSWFNFLAEIAPDVWEVAVRTFLNPIDGISVVFRKVAERAKR